MSRTVIICDEEVVQGRGARQLVASHGIVEATGDIVVVPSVSPQELGAKLDPKLHEWVIDDADSESSCPRG